MTGELLGVVRHDPLTWTLLGLLFAAGAGLGLGGIALRRRRRSAIPALGWLTLAAASACNLVGLLSMIAVQASPPVAALTRGLKASELRAMRTSEQARARTILVSGATLSVVPLAIGVALLRKRRAGNEGPPVSSR